MATDFPGAAWGDDIWNTDAWTNDCWDPSGLLQVWTEVPDPSTGIWTETPDPPDTVTP